MSSVPRIFPVDINAVEAVVLQYFNTILCKCITCRRISTKYWEVIAQRPTADRRAVRDDGKKHCYIFAATTIICKPHNYSLDLTASLVRQTNQTRILFVVGTIHIIWSLARTLRTPTIHFNNNTISPFSFADVHLLKRMFILNSLANLKLSAIGTPTSRETSL